MPSLPSSFASNSRRPRLSAIFLTRAAVRAEPPAHRVIRHAIYVQIRRSDFLRLPGLELMIDDEARCIGDASQFKQICHRGVERKQGAHSRRKLGRCERVTAEARPVVANADPVEIKR